MERLIANETQPINANVLDSMDLDEAEDLVQWSDVILFDFLTGNYDRVASMMVSLY